MAESKAITEAEVARHNTRDDCWCIVEGGVYNVTDYLVKHPGGVNLLLRCAGADATADFKAMFHSKRARNALVPLYVGHLVGQQPPQLLSPHAASSAPVIASRGPYGLGSAVNPVTLPKRVPVFSAIQHFVVSKTVQESPTCKRITVEAHRTARGMKLIPVQHVKIHQDDVVRSYTPVATAQGGKSMVFVIKKYEAPAGIMSRYLHSLQVGDPVQISGPYGEFRFSSWTIRQKPTSLLVCCIGTGIAPMIQLLAAVSRKYWSKGKPFPVHLLYGERFEENVLFKTELAELQASAGSSSNLSTNIFYSSKGKRVDASALLNTCPMDKIRSFSLCAICGTDEFVESMEKVAQRFKLAVVSF